MRKGLKALLSKLNDELPNLMRAWSPCSNDSDYQCMFCSERASTNLGSVEHKTDCLGAALARELPYTY
jgi:hypothetical protein